MKRIDALRTVSEVAGDRLIVCNLGDPARELFQAADRAENFYMLGSMGLASSIGLGLALALKDRRVIALVRLDRRAAFADVGTGGPRRHGEGGGKPERRPGPDAA